MFITGSYSSLNTLMLAEIKKKKQIQPPLLYHQQSKEIQPEHRE